MARFFLAHPGTNADQPNGTECFALAMHANERVDDRWVQAPPFFSAARRVSGNPLLVDQTASAPSSIRVGRRRKRFVRAIPHW